MVRRRSGSALLKTSSRRYADRHGQIYDGTPHAAPPMWAAPQCGVPMSYRLFGLERRQHCVAVDAIESHLQFESRYQLDIVDIDKSRDHAGALLELDESDHGWYVFRENGERRPTPRPAQRRPGAGLGVARYRYGTMTALPGTSPFASRVKTSLMADSGNFSTFEMSLPRWASANTSSSSLRVPQLLAVNDAS